MSPTSILFLAVAFAVVTVFLVHRIVEALHRIASRIGSTNAHLGELRAEVTALTEVLGPGLLTMKTKQDDLIASVESVEEEIQSEDFYSDSVDVYERAKELIMDGGKASASLLQRRLVIGYSRAAQILDKLEEDGIIGPANGGRPREVLV